MLLDTFSTAILAAFIPVWETFNVLSIETPFGYILQIITLHFLKLD